VKTLGAGPVQHFTNAVGIQGITGLLLGELAVGQTVSVERLSFGQGSNAYLAANAGDIFVTEIGTDATAGQL